MGRAFEFRKARKFKRWGNMARTFTRIGKEISIAVKAGGPDPHNNPRLRVLMQNAKAENMPKENVERAIKRASSKEMGDYKEVSYDAYGPGGVGIVIEAATDNTNRTVTSIRTILGKLGGQLGQSGCLDFMFERKTVFKIHPADSVDLEELELELIDYGVDEMAQDEDGNVIIYGSFESYGKIQKYLDDNNIEILSGEFVRFPNDTKEVTPEHRETIEKILERLEEDDDVTNVFHNMAEAEEE